jgi:hypothetical protein
VERNCPWRCPAGAIQDLELFGGQVAKFEAVATAPPISNHGIAAQHFYFYD